MNDNRAAIIKELVVIAVVAALLLAAAGLLVRNVVVAVRSLDGTQAVDDFSVADLEQALRDLAGKLLPADGPKRPPAPAPAVSPPADQAKPPASENKKGEVTAVRFFAAGRDIPQPQARQYAAQFGPQAGNIYVEIVFKNFSYQKADASIPVVVQCLDAAGRTVAERQATAKPKKEWASSALAARLLAAEAGALKSGQYTVKLFFDGAYIDDYKFTIN